MCVLHCVQMQEHNAFRDFGPISVVVISTDATRTFYIVDGWHRCVAMRRLVPLGRTIPIHLGVKVVPTEAQAVAELRLCRTMCPSDPRDVFASQAMAEAAAAVLAALRQHFTAPDMWHDVAASQDGISPEDPKPPYLNQRLVFGLLKDSGLPQRGRRQGLCFVQALFVCFGINGSLGWRQRVALLVWNS